MIDNSIETIKNELEKLKINYDELERNYINVVTGTTLGIGENMVRYGLIYKAINDTKDMTSALHNLEMLKRDDHFDDCGDIDIFVEKIISYMKREKYSPESWEMVQFDVLNVLTWDYILDCVLRGI